MDFLQKLETIPPPRDSVKRYSERELNELPHIKEAKEHTKETTQNAHTDFYRGLKMNIVDIDTRPVHGSNTRRMTDDLERALKPRNRDDHDDVKVVKRRYRPLLGSNLASSSNSNLLNATIQSSHAEPGKKRNERTQMAIDSKKATENLVSQIRTFRDEVEENQEKFGLKKLRRGKKSKINKRYCDFTCSEDFMKAKVPFQHPAFKEMRVQENMEQMNDLITASEEEEKRYLKKTGEGFSTVAGYYRRNARKKAKEETSKVLDEIRNRNRGIDLNFLSKPKTVLTKEDLMNESHGLSSSQNTTPEKKKSNIHNRGGSGGKKRRKRKSRYRDDWSDRLNKVMSLASGEAAEEGGGLLSQQHTRSSRMGTRPGFSQGVGGGQGGGGSRSFKASFVKEIKKKSYLNYLNVVQQKRIEKMNLKTKEKHENEVQNYKNKLSEAMNERNNALFENKFLQEKSQSKDEEIKSLRYTITILNAKLGKMTEKEILNEQKLKVFEQYQPLFEHLSSSFHFNSPQEVIDRLSRLEKNLKDSYDKLLTTENEKSTLERKVSELRKQEKIKIGIAISEKVRELKEEKRKSKEMLNQLTTYRNTLKNYKQYEKKYLNLQNLVNNLWTTLQRRVKKETNETIGCEPDPTIPEEVVSSIDNWIMAFTKSTEEETRTFHVCKSTKAFQRFSQLANSFWLKYFKERSEMKNDPYKIFSEVGKLLRKEVHISSLQRTKVNHLKKEKFHLVGQIEEYEKKLKSSINSFKRQQETIQNLTSSIRSRPKIMTTTSFNLSSSSNNRYNRRPQTSGGLMRSTFNSSGGGGRNISRRKKMMMMKKKKNVKIKKRKRASTSYGRSRMNGGGGGFSGTSKNKGRPKTASASLFSRGKGKNNSMVVFDYTLPL